MLVVGSGNEAAFTLVELLVVCLLISLTLAVSVPALRDTLLTDQLKATSRKIIGAIRERREEAVRDQQSVCAVCRYGKETYLV